jgi:hypothetical protein
MMSPLWCASSTAWGFLILHSGRNGSVITAGSRAGAIELGVVRVEGDGDLIRGAVDDPGRQLQDAASRSAHGSRSRAISQS